MILKEIIYQQPDHPIYNKSKMTGLSLGRINLIVGKNGSGKSRLARTINNSAKMIAGSRQGRNIGHTKLSFISGKSNYIYELNNDGSKLDETILHNGIEIFRRDNGKSKILSDKTKDYIFISPPADKLIFHSRRDAIEYPEIEKIAKWAEGVNLFTFGHFSIKESIVESIPIRENLYQEILGMIVSLEESASGVIENFNLLGFEIEKISVKKSPTYDGYEAYFWEKGFNRQMPFSEMSQGMYRTLMFLFYLEYLSKNNLISTLIIDDLCEGVDYVRATKLGKLLFNWVKDQPNIQLIATSNDSYLMDVVPIEYWNILIREGNHTRCLNYENSKEIFDEFKFTGLSPFDLFSSDYLLSKAA